MGLITRDTRPLHNYQAIANDWALARMYSRGQKGAGLFLDPGLGKTRTSLTTAQTLIDLNEVRRVLVIAPLRPVYNVWPSQIEQWFGRDLSYSILHDQYKQAFNLNCQIEIVNPEGLPHLVEQAGRWDLLIIDESTKFKHWSTRRMAYLKKLLPFIRYRMILTGTPAANSLADLHAQMYILDDGARLGKTVTYFRDRFMMRGGWQGRQWVMRPDKEKELLGLVQDCCLRMDAETYLDMPELVHNDIWVELPPECRTEYNRLKRELYAQLESGDVFATTAAGAYTKCKQFANGQVYNTGEDGVKTSHKAHDLKLTALADLAEELSGKPLLLLYEFKHDLEYAQNHKAFKNAPFIRGRMKAKDVEKILYDWNCGITPVLMAQWQTISHGINMQDGGCNDIGWLGIPDNPEIYDQGFRRVYRQGVKGKQVRVHRVLARKTVNETQLERLLDKNMTQADFLDKLKEHARSAA